MNIQRECRHEENSHTNADITIMNTKLENNAMLMREGSQRTGIHTEKQFCRRKRIEFAFCSKSLFLYINLIWTNRPSQNITNGAEKRFRQKSLTRREGVSWLRINGMKIMIGIRDLENRIWLFSWWWWTLKSFENLIQILLWILSEMEPIIGTG